MVSEVRFRLHDDSGEQTVHEESRNLQERKATSIDTAPGPRRDHMMIASPGHLGWASLGGDCNVVSIARLWSEAFGVGHGYYVGVSGQQAQQAPREMNWPSFHFMLYIDPTVNRESKFHSALRVQFQYTKFIRYVNKSLNPESNFHDITD
jgi:hypothetical protein